MAKENKHLNHLKTWSDLVTPLEETRAGFISLALEKNYLAVPYVEEAKTLKVLASKADNPDRLREIAELRNSLLTAAGVSDKARSYLTEADNQKAIDGLIENFLKPAGSDFVNELVYRYLLIKGDALGGKARNLAGTLGERKFLRSLLSVLSITGTDYYWLNDESLTWMHKPSNDAGIERNIKGLYWESNSSQRVLLMNMTVPIVGKNVDLCLLNGHMGEVFLNGPVTRSLHRKTLQYLALGELKGGLDPAGADEHWKTANSALRRIRERFIAEGREPQTFFVGAAIENSMAREIFGQIESGVLNNAANLTVDSQLVALNNWLINI
jgi:type II restriction enzyme